MASFNKVIIAGNLTRDPELRYTPKGMAVCKVSLAINRNWTSESGEKREEVVFVECDAWGKTAENIGQYMKKGSPMLIEGRLKLDQWTDKETGKPRQRLGVTVETCQFLSSGNRDGGEQQEREPSRGFKPPPGSAAARADTGAQTDAPEEDSDVPFNQNNSGSRLAELLNVVRGITRPYA